MLGLDHLLAMAAIGFWSVRQGKLMKNATPAFVIGATLAITLVGGGLGSPMLKTDSRFSRGIGGVLAVAGAYLAAA